MRKEKWRGIKTTSIAKHEDKPKTVINRFGQKTLSLPRITDDKRWAGYPRITGISRKLASIIARQNFLVYIEPFAGTAKVYQELLKKTSIPIVVLNDTSDFLYKWLKKQFPGPIIQKKDFWDCVMSWNLKKSFFMFDLPWFMSSYDQTFSSFNRESVKKYSLEVITLCKGYIHGKFIITTRKENRIMLDSGFNNYLIKSEYAVSGKYPQVLLTTNLKLRSKMVKPC